MNWPWVGGSRSGSAGSEAGETQLVERLKRREEQAFLELYDRYAQTIHRFLVYMTGSIAVAEDLTQEIFALVLGAVFDGGFRRFDPDKGTLEGYLLGIARNLARKEFRRGQRTVPLESPEGEGLIQRLCHEPFLEAMVQRQELARLHAAILELPTHYREVLVLCCLEDRGYEDAARILECSTGTIASRIHRAKTLLAAKLKGDMAEQQTVTDREEMRR